MSGEHVGWALRQETSNATAKLVLCGFAAHADALTGICWPSRRTVGRYAGIEVRQAYRYVAELEEAGLLTRVKLSDLDDENRQKYQSIPERHRPTLWRVGPVLSDTGVIGDDMSDPVTGVSSDDIQRVNTKSSSKSGGSKINKSAAGGPFRSEPDRRKPEHQVFVPDSTPVDNEFNRKRLEQLRTERAGDKDGAA